MSGSQDERPDKDLRTAEDERALQPQPDRSGDEGRDVGRLGRAARAARKAVSKRRSEQGAAKLKQARESREKPSLGQRVLGEDTAAEVAGLLDSVGPDADGQAIRSRLSIDHDGDGKDLAAELGIQDPAETQTASGVSRPSLDDDLGLRQTDPFATPPSLQDERDLQSFDNIGNADGRSRDSQLDRDLQALGMAGAKDRRDR